MAAHRHTVMETTRTEIMKTEMTLLRSWRLFVLLTLIPFLGGCGLLLIDGPPVGWRDIEDPDRLEAVALLSPCTSGKALVIADGAYAAVLGSTLLYELSEDPRPSSAEVIPVVLALGTWSYSAWSGNQKVNDCSAFNSHVYQHLQSTVDGQAQSASGWKPR